MSASVVGRKEGITVGKSFVYVGTICRQDKRLGRAWLGGVRIWSLYPPQRLNDFPPPSRSLEQATAAPIRYSKKKKSSNILKNKTIVSVACQQALHLGESRELTRHQK